MCSQAEPNAKAIQRGVESSNCHAHSLGSGPHSYIWRNIAGVAITETIFRLRKDNDGWIRTIEFMAENHRDFFKRARPGRRTYNAEFTDLVERHLRKKFGDTDTFGPD